MICSQTGFLRFVNNAYRLAFYCVCVAERSHLLRICSGQEMQECKKWCKQYRKTEGRSWHQLIKLASKCGICCLKVRKFQAWTSELLFVNIRRTDTFSPPPANSFPSFLLHILHLLAENINFYWGFLSVGCKKSSYTTREFFMLTCRIILHFRWNSRIEK